MSDWWCALGLGCSGAENGSQAPRRVSGGWWLCPDDRRAAERDVAALVDDYRMLSQIVGRRTVIGDVKTARPHPASTPPIDLTVDALRSMITWSTGVWEEIVRDYCSMASRETRNARDGYNVQQSVAILAPRVDLLVSLPSTPCLPYGCEELRDMTGLAGLKSLLAIHAAATELIGLDRRTVRLPGDCTACGSVALRRDVGADDVYCDVCGWAAPYVDYQAFVLLNVDPPPEVVAAREAVTGSTIDR